MSRILRRNVQHARKAVECGDHYPPNGSGWIEKGQSYVRLALPPYCDPWDADHWVVLRLHPECFDYQTPGKTA